jgi:hypothetical protein
MGDAGEGLIDAEARIQERMEDLAHERAQKHVRTVRDPERLRVLETLRLARTELERQFNATAHERRRAQLQQAMDEIGRRMEEASAAINS